MITYTVDKIVSYSPLRRYVEGVCLKDDTKPTTNIANGSRLIIMDDSKIVHYDEQNEQWRDF